MKQNTLPCAFDVRKAVTLFTSVILPSALVGIFFPLFSFFCEHQVESIELVTHLSSRPKVISGPYKARFLFSFPNYSYLTPYISPVPLPSNILLCLLDFLFLCALTKCIIVVLHIIYRKELC